MPRGPGGIGPVRGVPSGSISLGGAVAMGTGIHDGIFRSGDPANTPNTFSLTFDQAFLDSNPVAGDAYEYFCEVHQAFGQEGVINVMGGASPVPALPTWGLFAAIGGIVGGACLILRKKRGGLPQA